jgi:hypothetical protein
MPLVHVVEQGETIVALSERYGLFAQTIWDDPANADLRARRKRMDVLLPGDEVTIADRREKSVSAVTGRRHRFRRKGIPAIFRLVLREDGEPRVGVAWRLSLAGVESTGRTGDDGLIEQYVPAGSTEGKLYLDASEEPIVLRFGHMDPETSISGMRKRLANLGIPAPDDDDVEGQEWRYAVAALQARADLPQTGILDVATRDALIALHDKPDGWKTP